MKCPHCLVSVNEGWSQVSLLQERPGGVHGQVWQAWSMICPECGNFIGEFRRATPDGSSFDLRVLGWPRGTTRPAPSEVEEDYATDFAEAVAVLPLSTKASAALSRRLLQHILREKAGVKAPNLDKEIQQVIDSGSVPSWLADNLDAVRQIGNFASHPIKSKNTAEVVEVEPGEAEWLLDVLESLFDFYFVQPVKSAERREALNEKLRDAGKPALKKSSS